MLGLWSYFYSAVHVSQTVAAKKPPFIFFWHSNTMVSMRFPVEAQRPAWQRTSHLSSQRLMTVPGCSTVWQQTGNGERGKWRIKERQLGVGRERNLEQELGRTSGSQILL